GQLGPLVLRQQRPETLLRYCEVLGGDKRVDDRGGHSTPAARSTVPASAAFSYIPRMMVSVTIGRTPSCSIGDARPASRSSMTSVSRKSRYNSATCRALFS